MVAALVFMVIMWWGLQSGEQQSCVNSNHAVSLMCPKLSLRNQSALGGLQANQHLHRWTGWTGWLAAYSVCQQRVEEKSNTAELQTGQKKKRFCDFFQNDSPTHTHTYTHTHTHRKNPHKLDTFHIHEACPPPPFPPCRTIYMWSEESHTWWAVLMEGITSQVWREWWRVSAASVVSRWWFPVFANWCCNFE